MEHAWIFLHNGLWGRIATVSPAGDGRFEIIPENEGQQRDEFMAHADDVQAVYYPESEAL